MRPATNSTGLQWRDWQTHLHGGRVYLAGRAVRVAYPAQRAIAACSPCAPPIREGWTLIVVRHEAEHDAVERLAEAGLWPWSDAGAHRLFACSRCEGSGVLAPRRSRCWRCGGFGVGVRPWSFGEAAALSAAPAERQAADGMLRGTVLRDGARVRCVTWAPVVDAPEEVADDDPPRYYATLGPFAPVAARALRAWGLWLLDAERSDDGVGVRVGYPALPETFTPGAVTRRRGG
jgi:hypothetical protein